MSKFSGKADLYDTLMMQHFRTAEGSDKKEDLDKARVYYSDEYECFSEFKEATNGTIYQHKKIEVNLGNQDMIASMCKNFEVIELPLKNNQRKPRYTYKYYTKEYKSLKEINKQGVYITLEIHFNTILDLIPYYPYIGSVMFSNEGKKIIYISDELYTIEERDRMLKFGHSDSLNMYEYYTKQLQEHYIEAVQRYYTPKESNEVIEEVTFDEDNKALVKYPIDERFGVEWDWLDEVNPYWDDPHIIDAKKGIISQSKENRNLCGDALWVKYYKYEEPKLYLE